MQHTIHIETIKSAVNCPLLNQGPFLAIQSFLMRQKKICLKMRLISTYTGISGRYQAVLRLMRHFAYEHNFNPGVFKWQLFSLLLLLLKASRSQRSQKL